MGWRPLPETHEKIRRLPEIDLARIATLPHDLQRKQLEHFKHGRPPFSCDPLRRCLHDILNVQLDLFAQVVASEWIVIEATLHKTCRTPAELKANILAARGLHDFALGADMMGRRQGFFPLPMSTGRKVEFWLPFVLAMGGVRTWHL